MKFEQNDGGRSTSKRPKQKNDCTVRALALATEVLYDTAYDFLAEKGRKCGRGFHLQTYLDELSKTNNTIEKCVREKGNPLNGYWVVKHSFPAVAGQPRMNVERFLLAYPQGMFILRMSKHVAAVNMGVLYDTFDCRRGEKCVYTAFQICA